jgi:hypothetical protein
MKIVKRITKGNFKGYTIRKSKFGWFDLYSKEGISQTHLINNEILIMFSKLDKQ